MQHFSKLLLLFLVLTLSACSSEQNEQKNATDSKLKQFKKTTIQAFKSQYGTVEIQLPSCIKEGYTTEISLTDQNNRVCESRGIYFSVDAISTYKLREDYELTYTQKHKENASPPNNSAAYIIDYAIEKRIQIMADFISSEFQFYQTIQGDKLWVKSMYGHKNEFADEQFYLFGGFVKEEVCYMFQFICLNKNSKYYFNDFIQFFKSAIVY